MSFTADIYNEILSDISISISSYHLDHFAMRLVKYDNGIMVAFAVDIKTLTRYAFFSVKTKISKNVFPHWKGVSIKITTLPDYGVDSYFVCLAQTYSSDSSVFEIIVEDLRSQLEAEKISENSLSVINRILLKWKKFFTSEKKIVLSDERQQGLYGELLFLTECIEFQGIEAVLHWSGSENETHDFYIGSHAVEVKTTSLQEPYYASISSEYQLDSEDVPGHLFLRFYALRKSQSSGERLFERIDLIRIKLIKNQSILYEFNEKLHQYGYFDELSDNYTCGYYQRDNYCFVINDDFPKITKRDLPNGIADLKYRVNIMLCMPYVKDLSSMFEILKG